MKKQTSRIKENIMLIEPMRFIAALRKNAWLIVVGITLFAGIGVFVTKIKESKSWSATAKIIRYDKKVSMTNEIPYQFQNFNYETALETIRTRANLVELIERLGLKTTPEALFSKFEIKRGRNSDVIEIIFTANDKKLAADGANTLSRIFIDNFYTIQNAAIERIYRYYEKSKQSKLEELETTKKNIADFLRKHKLVSFENELEIHYAQLNRIQLQRLQNQTQKDALKTAIDEINASLTGMEDKVKLSYTVRSANNKDLEEAYRQLNRLKAIYTDEHPSIKILKSEITQLEKRAKDFKSDIPYEVSYGDNPIKSQMVIELGKNKVAYVTAENTDGVLKEQIETLKKEIDHLSTLKRSFDQLLMQKQEAEQELVLVSNRLYDLKITIGSSNEDFKFFEEAKIPELPKPSFKKVIIILFTLMGLIVAVVFILIREFLNNTVKTKFDLQKRFGIENVVQLPANKKGPNEIGYIFSYMASDIISSATDEPCIIAVGSDQPKSLDHRPAAMLLEQLAHQHKKILHIKMITKNDENSSALVFSMSTPPNSQNFHFKRENEYIDKACWLLEENYTLFIPDLENVSLVYKNLKTLGYSYLVIEAPAYTQAKHLIPELLLHSDAFVLVVRFGISSRKIIYDLMKRAEHKGIEKIKGVIIDTHKYFIS